MQNHVDQQDRSLPITKRSRLKQNPNWISKILPLCLLAVGILTQGISANQHQIPPADGGTANIEAEAYSAVSGEMPFAEFCADCSGQSNLGFFWFDTWFELTVESPEMLNYDVSFRSASPTGTLVEVWQINGTEEKLLGTMNVPDTDSYTNYTDSESTTISLPAGTHTLRFKNVQEAANIDFVSFTAGSANDIIRTKPIASEGPDKNPLKGWTSGWWRENEDHASVGFQYIEWGRFEPQDDVFNWDYVEEVLDRPGTKDRHFIIQFVCDWDGYTPLEDNYLGPDWLLPLVGENVGNADPSDPDSRLMRATNYDHQIFIDEAIEAIQKLHERYQDDPRAFVIQVGVLGLWAEWHTFPREDWSPLTETKQEILNAYFNILGENNMTQVRYPDEPVNVPRPRMGYTNGSVVPTVHGYEFGEGIAPAELWRNGPVGGEWPPNVEEVDLWNRFFNTVEGFDFINQAAYSTVLPPQVDEIEAMLPGWDSNAQFMDMHRHLGYNFRVQQVRHLVSASGTHIEVELGNVGIAPFYKKWDLQLALLDTTTGEVAELIQTATDIRDISPNETITIAASSCISVDSVGQYQLGLRILQPGADENKTEAWKLDPRNTFVSLANGISTIEGSWNSDNALQGGWQILGGVGVVPGDVNQDGKADLLDVDPFILSLSTGEYNAAADVNVDGAVNLLDVERFIEILAGDD